MKKNQRKRLAVLALCLAMLTGGVFFSSQNVQAADAAIQQVSLNRATSEELQTVRGIGPALAERILEFRSQNGAFKSLEELKEVKGIGESKYNRIKDSFSL